MRKSSKAEQQASSQSLMDKIYMKKLLIDRAERPRARDFFMSDIIRWLLVFNVILIIAITGVTTWFIRPSEYELILHYNAFFGVSEEMFGAWWHAYRTTLFGIIVLSINTVLAFFSYRGCERIAAYSLLLGAFLVQCALIVVTVSVIIVNR